MYLRSESAVVDSAHGLEGVVVLLVEVAVRLVELIREGDVLDALNQI
jgi:hypothetical protein